MKNQERKYKERGRLGEKFKKDDEKVKKKNKNGFQVFKKELFIFLE